MHALPPNIRSGVAPQRQGLLIVPEFDADFFKNDVGIGFDERQAFFIENFRIPRRVA